MSRNTFISVGRMPVHVFAKAAVAGHVEDRGWRIRGIEVDANSES